MTLKTMIQHLHDLWYEYFSFHRQSQLMQLYAIDTSNTITVKVVAVFCTSSLMNWSFKFPLCNRRLITRIHAFFLIGILNSKSSAHRHRHIT